MRKFFSIIISCVLCISILTGCGIVGKKPEQKTGINVVTTIFPCYDFSRAVLGKDSNIKMLIKPGSEVHAFDPSPSDILNIQKCDVFVYIGGESEAWVDKVLSSVDTSGKTIIRLMDAVTPVEEELIGEEDRGHDEIEYDEHIWTSPVNAIKMVNFIKDSIAARYDNDEKFAENAKSYINELSEIDSEFREVVMNARNKTIVVADKFPIIYFTKEYGLNHLAAFSGCSTETEVSAKTLANLIDTVNSKDIKGVFFIEMSNQNIAKAVSNQTGVQTLLFHSCHNVTADEFAGGETYVSLMKKNIENLRKGLS